MDDQQPLRVVLILEGSCLPAWQLCLLERINALLQVRIVTVLCAPRRKSLGQYLAETGLGWLRTLDAFLFRVSGNAQRPLDVSDVLSDTPWLAWRAAGVKQDIEALDVDVVLDLSGRAQWPEWLYTRSRYGLWSCLYGDAGRDMAWAGVSAYVQGDEEARTAIGMQQYPGQPPRLMFVSDGSTDLSLSQTTDALLWKLATIFPECLVKLQAAPGPFFQTARRRFGESDYSGSGAGAGAGSSQAVCLPEMASSLFIAASRVFVCHVLRYLMTKLLYQRHWILLTQSIDHPLQPLHQLTGATPLMPPPGYFWADPCLLEHEGRQYVFFEEYVFAQGKGRLACIELDDTGGYSPALTVLELPYHLSYPFLFHYQGDLYLIPESAENRTIDLYRCERFPDKWVHVKTLMADVDAYDATLYVHDGRWWMFVNLRDHPGGSPHELLYLFSADNPLSDTWEAHPYNPIVSQAASARPAGALFEHEGIIYRPSQNCAGSYGRGLNLNQVMEWNRTSYTEKIIDQCIPAGEGGLEGIHTFSFVHGRVISDGIYVRKRWKGQHD